MHRSTVVLVLLLLIAALSIFSAGPAAADPRFCITYDFTGSQLCVSENGIEDEGPLLPEPTWVCLTPDPTGGQVCISSYGQIEPGP